MNQRKAKRQQREKHNKPKQHHWVPSFYLKYFATLDTIDSDTPRAWIFSKHHSDGDEELTSVDKICKKNFLYAPKDADAQRTFEMEEKLSDLEGIIGQLWLQLADGRVDLGQESIRKGISLFLSTLALRHPDNLVFISNMAHNMLRDEGISDLQPGEHLKNESKKAFVNLIRTQATKVAELMMKKRWSMIVTKTPTFVTSDKPVVAVNKAGQQVGFGSPVSLIHFPISPTRVLVMDDNKDEPANIYRELKDGSAGALNLSIWRAASRFLITGRKVPEVLAEIQDWSSRWASENGISL